MEKQSFNVNADFLGGYPQVFIKLIVLIVLVYALILILNFFRDKFIHKPENPKKDNITDLVIILNKLFFITGFGFVIANLLQMLLTSATGSRNRVMNFGGDWDYATFGVILIFAGIGFRAVKDALAKESSK